MTEAAHTNQAGPRFASLALQLAEEPESTAQRIVDLAVTTIACHSAAITTVRHDGTLNVIAASDRSVLMAAVNIAGRTGQSATRATVDAKSTIINNDVENDPRWEAYRQLITANTPIRSTASFYLALAGVELGVISFLSYRPGFFTPMRVEDCAVYADHAAVALKAAAAERLSTQLAEAVITNREIGIATGILMARYTLDRHAAFDMLVVASSNTNRKLRNTAAETADTGDIPTWQPART